MPSMDSPPKLDAGQVDLEAERPDAALLIEEAEAEAAEAEALAEAARARVRAIRLRQQGAAADTVPPGGSEVAAVDGEATDAARLVADERGKPPPGRKVRRFRRPRRTTVALLIGILCTATLVTASAVMLRQHDGLMRKQQRAAEFTAAARQVVVTLMSISAASAKEDVHRILDSSTGQFRDEFQRAAEDFTKVAQSAKVSTKTTVQAAALEEMTDDTAVVLVAANSTLINTTGAPEQPRSWRLSVKLAREGGQIKMSSMEFIP